MTRRRSTVSHRLAALGLLLVCFIVLTVTGFAISRQFATPEFPSTTRADEIAQQIIDPAHPNAKDRSGMPIVEPVKYYAVAREDARHINALIPFSARPNPAAEPFRPQLPPADLGRAIDCLAAASWYEAGNDPIGQQAVIQVVLNRVRHGSFPNSVCGVVFQGSERATGCQFSFTCDGALQRIPSTAAWLVARGLAQAALGGFVFRAVGLSTHYHTDWVVPYWSATVDKTAVIHTHLFFRWRGPAGNAAAFHQGYAGKEPIVPRLASLSATGAPSTAGDPALTVAQDIAADDAVAGGELTSARTQTPDVVVPPAALRGNTLAAYSDVGNAFAVRVSDKVFSGSLALMALDLCALRSTAPCTVYAAVPAGNTLALGVNGRLNNASGLDFYYSRDSTRGREVALWNCTRWPRPDPRQCLPADFRVP